MWTNIARFSWALPGRDFLDLHKAFDLLIRNLWARLGLSNVFQGAQFLDWFWKGHLSEVALIAAKVGLSIDKKVSAGPLTVESEPTVTFLRHTCVCEGLNNFHYFVVMHRLLLLNDFQIGSESLCVRRLPIIIVQKLWSSRHPTHRLYLFLFTLHHVQSRRDVPIHRNCVHQNLCCVTSWIVVVTTDLWCGPSVALLGAHVTWWGAAQGCPGGGQLGADIACAACVWSERGVVAASAGTASCRSVLVGELMACLWCHSIDFQCGLQIIYFWLG